MNRGSLYALGVMLLFSASTSMAQIKLTPNNPSGVYKLEDKPGWTVVKTDSADSSQYTFSLKRNGVDVLKQGTLEFVEGKATVDGAPASPGALFLEILPVDQPRGRNRRILDGALVDPASFQPTLKRPADFESWWAEKLKQQSQIPPNAKLENGDAGKAGIDYSKLTLDTIDGKQIHGQLARPTPDGKYPAILILQWAGIYALQKSSVVNRASHGWLALNIEPHDIEIDRDPAYYQQLTTGELRDYYHQGNSDREKSYFLRMYLSAYRAAEYLTTRPDWDGKTFVVMGTSMGGQQSFAVAGLDEKVTAMLVLVPSSCDSAGPTNTQPRAAGFPDWAAQAEQKHDPSIIQTGSYFDPAFFASRIKCPALVSMGLYDETSPPVGVYSAYNQIPGIKEALPLHSGHQDQAGSQRPYNARAEQWLAALVRGDPVPPN